MATAELTQIRSNVDVHLTRINFADDHIGLMEEEIAELKTIESQQRQHIDELRSQLESTARLHVTIGSLSRSLEGKSSIIADLSAALEEAMTDARQWRLLKQQKELVARPVGW